MSRSASPIGLSLTASFVAATLFVAVLLGSVAHANPHRGTHQRVRSLHAPRLRAVAVAATLMTACTVPTEAPRESNRSIAQPVRDWLARHYPEFHAVKRRAVAGAYGPAIELTPRSADPSNGVTPRRIQQDDHLTFYSPTERKLFQTIVPGAEGPVTLSVPRTARLDMAPLVETIVQTLTDAFQIADLSANDTWLWRSSTDTGNGLELTFKFPSPDLAEGENPISLGDASIALVPTFAGYGTSPQVAVAWKHVTLGHLTTQHIPIHRKLPPSEAARRSGVRSISVVDQLPVFQRTYYEFAMQPSKTAEGDFISEPSPGTAHFTQTPAYEAGAHGQAGRIRIPGVHLSAVESDPRPSSTR